MWYFYSCNYDSHGAHAEKTASAWWINYFHKGQWTHALEISHVIKYIFEIFLFVRLVFLIKAGREILMLHYWTKPRKHRYNENLRIGLFLDMVQILSHTKMQPWALVIKIIPTAVLSTHVHCSVFVWNNLPMYIWKQADLLKCCSKVLARSCAHRVMWAPAIHVYFLTETKVGTNA